MAIGIASLIGAGLNKQTVNSTPLDFGKVEIASLDFKHLVRINDFWSQNNPKCNFLHHLIQNPKRGVPANKKLY